MGVFSMSVGTQPDCTDKKYPPGNPNPREFKILDVYSEGNFCCAKIQYPNCNNYEGVKILVYMKTKEWLNSQTFLDPHFLENDNSPIARFEPTVEGWTLAKAVAAQLARMKNR